MKPAASAPQTWRVGRVPGAAAVGRAVDAERRADEQRPVASNDCARKLGVPPAVGTARCWSDVARAAREQHGRERERRGVRRTPQIPSSARRRCARRMSPPTASRPVAQAVCGDMLPSQSCSQCSRVHVTVTSAGADARARPAARPRRGAASSRRRARRPARTRSRPAPCRRRRRSGARGARRRTRRRPSRGYPTDMARTATAPERLPFTGDDEADRLIAGDPVALLIGFVARSAGHRAEGVRRPARAAQAPRAPRRRAHRGDAIPSELAAAFRERPALHRFPGAMAERVRALCAFLEERYGGDAARIWREAESGEDLQRPPRRAARLRRDEGAHGADAAGAPVRRAPARASTRCCPTIRRSATCARPRSSPPTRRASAPPRPRGAPRRPTSDLTQGDPCSTTSGPSTA